MPNKDHRIIHASFKSQFPSVRVMTKSNATKKKHKSKSKPKVPGAGWTTGINTNTVSRTSETNIDKLLTGVDDEDVKDIVTEFDRLMDDEPLMERLMQLVRFPDQFVDNMETLLNNKASNILSSLYLTLRGWKVNIDASKKCQDIFGVGMGCASAFTHMVGELGVDAMHVVNQDLENLVGGIKTAPPPEEMKLVSLIASSARNDNINKSNNNMRFRLTIGSIAAKARFNRQLQGW